MSLTLHSNRQLIVALAIAIPAGIVAQHLFSIYRQISGVSSKQIHSSDTIPPSLRLSDTIRLHVNPHNHVAMEDTRYIDLAIPRGVSVPTDEALLAYFVKGFFGGKVLAFERSLLQMTRLEVTHYASIKSASPRKVIWTMSEVPPPHLPPLHSTLFGSFQVADISLASFADPSEASHIDFVFGNGASGFAGVHRFTVSRPQAAPEAVRILYAHLTCNPTVNTPLQPERVIHTLHNIYAMLLFREGVAEVKRFLRQ